MPSSVAPLQSSSILLQASVAGRTPPWHWNLPLMHFCWTTLHGGVIDAHGLSWPLGLLYVMPSESLSMPSQSSSVDTVAPTHSSVPPMQWLTPGVQGGLLRPQAVPSSVVLSSNRPLQSSSCPLQISGLGVCSPMHWNAPLMHFF